MCTMNKYCSWLLRWYSHLSGGLDLETVFCFLEYSIYDLTSGWRDKNLRDFIKKYFNLCSEDEQILMGFEQHEGE